MNVGTCRGIGEVGLLAMVPNTWDTHRHEDVAWIVSPTLLRIGGTRVQDVGNVHAVPYPRRFDG
jgi:hypothetical protein